MSGRWQLGNVSLSVKANVGHSPTAGILNGFYQAGVNGSTNKGYNHGLSSWTASDIVTYPSGMRTIVTKRVGSGGPDKGRVDQNR